MNKTSLTNNKKIEKLDIIEVGTTITTNSNGTGTERLIKAIIPESEADRKLALKLNEIIDYLNKK